MNIKNYLISLTIATLFASACAKAPVYSHKHDGQLKYISADMRNSFSISDFPADESEEYYNDFETLKEWQKKRTKEQCLAADRQHFASIQEIFPEYRDFFDSLSNSDKQFLYRVYEDAHTINVNVKRRFTRPRPFLSDPSLNPCENIGRIGGYAYPSGHATMAGTFEGVMLAIDPQNAAGIKAAVRQAGLNRVIAGVHHPTDISAGDGLGREIFKEFSKNQKFMMNLKNLQKKYEKFKNEKNNR